MNDVKDKTNSKTLMLIIGIILTVLIIGGGTLAYWSWETNEDEKTAIQFTVTQNFSCSVDGGQDINQTEALIAPTTCLNSEGQISEHAIMREVTVGTEVLDNNLNINMDLWIKVNSLEDGLKNSKNFRYALTTSNTSCEAGVVSSGSFKGAKSGATQTILKRNFGASATEKYYLWIWLDAAEEDSSTMDQSFSLELGGECTNTPSANHPELDDGMIPVTIANDGTVKTVLSTDVDWYNYEEKKWANVVFVKETGTQSRSYYKNNPGKTVADDDILAYYVWIPRYKYRIPYKKCSEIPEAERSDMNKYPECYAPYSMDDADKAKLVNYYTCSENGSVTNSLTEINYALQNGKLISHHYYGENKSLITTLVDAYNIGVQYRPGSDDNTAPDYCSSINTPDGTELRIEASEFNGNNRLIGTGNEVSINIEFEAANSLKSNGDAINTYYTHPAFTFGTEELSGIWVGKFEIGHSADLKGNGEDFMNCTNAKCNNANGIIIKPDEDSLRFNTVLSFLYASKTMQRENNLWGLKSTQTDSHMIKNSEWGAVMYLSHSIYGINDEIRLNNNQNFLTGCGASEPNDKHTALCVYRYGGWYTSYPQSTTGNITGIFDMAGGAYEYVMGASSSVSFGDIPNLYYDVYIGSTMIDLCANGNCKGHALIETANWYDDYAMVVNSDSSWFARGGNQSQLENSGGFSSFGSNGNQRTNGGTRFVATPKR